MCVALSFVYEVYKRKDVARDEYYCPIVITSRALVYLEDHSKGDERLTDFVAHLHDLSTNFSFDYCFGSEIYQ